MDINSESIVKAEGLSIGYETDEGTLWAVKEVSFEVPKTSVFCIVGESGSGKTTLGNAISGLLPPYVLTQGYLVVDNIVVINNDKNNLKAARGIAVRIPQNPSSALNPYLKVRALFEDVMKSKAKNVSKAEVREAIVKYLSIMQLDEEVLELYPYQLSGGMAQRVAIALALAAKPRIIVADEPTSNLDAYLRSSVGSLLKRLIEFGITVIVITHDIVFASHVCNYIVVMYGGRVVEVGKVEEVLSQPLHPYTMLLIEAATLKKVFTNSMRVSAIEGVGESGCVYKSKCPYRVNTCQAVPLLKYVSKTHGVACWRAVT
ncbi:MAG: ABC transporter ATP-binding protein [Desulfurococcaceae archaeon]|nr:ABC transporter ATP-binding protein [Desulfurococcaceae archaeon]